ncbi:beta-xylosidase [Gandjariella thermophila]|nr:beta-xylosidase [Gandjariella thermophila]
MSRAARRLLAALAPLLAVALVAGCRPAGMAEADGLGGALGGGRTTSPPPPPAPLATDGGRTGPGVVASGGPDAPYNYAPTVLLDHGRYRMWWCSQLPGVGQPGDDVVYAEAGGPDGPFAAPDGRPADPVFHGEGGGFDAVHTCDPSVIGVGGMYYLYYTGAAGDRARGNAIGVAVSRDGITWARAAGGQPIVLPSEEVARENTYGAGQPSALYLDGWYYLMFTDTTGRAAGWNGAGQFVLRARDPVFATDRQVLTGSGFTPASGAKGPRTRSIVDAFSADWMWVDALNAFAVAHETAQGTTITFWDRDFTRNPYQPVLVGGAWREGPGLVRRPDGHAPVSTDDPCGRVPVDVVRATRDGAAPTDLAHFGIDLRGIAGCADPGRAAAVLDGYAVPSPQRTVDLVIGGVLVRVDRRSVAAALAVRVLDARPPGVDGLRIAAHLAAAVPAVRADGRPVGLLLDDGRLWPVPSADVATLNSSAVQQVSPERWDGYPRGTDLAAPR